MCTHSERDPIGKVLQVSAGDCLPFFHVFDIETGLNEGSSLTQSLANRTWSVLMDILPLPSLEILRKKFSYCAETGILSHNEKPAPRIIRSRNIARVEHWNKNIAGTAVGNCNGGDGRMRVRIGRRNFYAHRIVWLMHYGVEPDGVIDHINGNGADNRIINLRSVSSSTNSRNKIRKQRMFPKGVRQSGERYYAFAKLDGKFHSLGGYATIQDAADARLRFDEGKNFTDRHQLAHAVV